jgi:hypothetical protein
MQEFPPSHITPFDFTEALALSVIGRLQQAVARLRQWHQAIDYEAICLVPPIPPDGATDDELDDLEAELGIVLPPDYRLLLRMWHYLVVDATTMIWGLGHEGIYITDRPWTADHYPTPGSYLVMGSYGSFADGDHLVIKLDSPTQPVLVYLHEDGPCLEFYAPNVSLALWRMVQELTQRG